jgi:hypothetical protein
MAEDPSTSVPETTRCPWCSTVAPAGATTCSSCGAALVASAEGSVPGVTSIDAEAVLRGRTSAKPRGGLLGMLSGETGDTIDAPSAAELSSLAPPPADVRIEMMRLELDAERQRLEAEAAGMAADAVVDGEIARIPPGVLAPQAEVASPNGASAAEDELPTSSASPSDAVSPPTGTTPTPGAGAPDQGSPAAR